MPFQPASLDILSLRAAYAAGTLTPSLLVRRVLDRIDAAGEDAVWICKAPAAQLLARAAALEAAQAAGGMAALPLFGIPFAVKDNIDVAGLPTTAACPGFAYLPGRSASVVERLQAAGAILIGKTNLDQFATGLVGVRSPYGVSRNPFDPRYIPGGSSSGSAVAVASGLVSFALGTDTAGSGRIPAGCTNVVGLKPTRGLLSAAGVVPACRSLDCVSVFALTAEDAAAVLQAAEGPDTLDPFTRSAAPMPGLPASGFRFGVPDAASLEFFGDAEAARLFAEAVERLQALGGEPCEVALAPFFAVAELLYSGPWIAERTAAVGDFIRANPEATLPVTRSIIMAGEGFSAIDAFEGSYRLQALRREIEPLWRQMDVLLVPTSGTIYRIDEVEAEPLALNSNLGRYTNFVNLLDLSAIAVPAGFRPSGLPFGVTLIGPAFADAALAGLGGRLHRAAGLTLGATGAPYPAASAAAPADVERVDGIRLAVVGSHLSGEPLNHQLLGTGARLERTCRTRPCYRLYLLAGTDPARPGMVRTDDGCGHAIETEVWRIPGERLGSFLSQVPAPLAIGRIELEDGGQVLGFLCEAYAVGTAQDISGFGGWRGWRRARAQSEPTAATGGAGAAGPARTSAR